MATTVNPVSPEERRRFAHISAAGITFQGGSAAVDSSTIMAALVYQLTGSAVAVGALTTILRMGWVLPQLAVGFLAQRQGSSMPFFVFGAFGRASCLALLAVLLVVSDGFPQSALVTGVFVLWTGYAFISGIVAVPYNDIVARSIASERRSRLLAVRFFGGGVLALTVAVFADRAVSGLPFPASYAIIIGAAAGLMYLSSTLFVWPGEPKRPSPPKPTPGFMAYLYEGGRVFRRERAFRFFVFAQWSSAAALMALPFFVVAATELDFDIARIALLLGAQTLGALVANPLWGWWGDHHGKRSLLEGIAALRALPPLAMLGLSGVSDGLSPAPLMMGLLAIFFVLGGLMNGLTIAVIGFLMEISPDDQRPAYSGYFNALTAPAFLLPVLGGILVELTGTALVFAIAMAGASLQWVFVRLIKDDVVKPS
ncbi:MAG: MFS transporter [Gammaproteobacteria bacterium]|nr:MFS transporter [Gammaproteobacteria bacterium]